MEQQSPAPERPHAPSGSAPTKRQTIANAALQVFLRQGFAGASVDEIAAEARVSKPTIYAHFGSKEELFRHIIAAIVEEAQRNLTAFTPTPAQDARDVIRELSEYAEVWMRSILQPDLLALRRLVIGEAARFPDVALAYYRGGPLHVEAQLAGRLGELAQAGHLAVADPLIAAQQFGYLIVGPLQTRAMFVPGNLATPYESAQAIEIGVAAFLALHKV